MSVRIEVSYERDAELMAVTERLSDLPLKVSNKAYQTGKFKRVYLQGNVPEDERKTDQNMTDILQEMFPSYARYS